MMRAGIGTLGIILLIPLIAGTGIGLAVYTGAIKPPSAGLADMGDWGNATNDTIPVHTEIWIDNPNSFGLTVSRFTLTYGLSLQGVTIADGTVDELELRPGNRSQTITTHLIPANIPSWWAAHIQAGETSQASIDLSLSSPLLPFDAPLEPPDIGKPIQTDLIGMMEQALDAIEGSYTGPPISIAGIRQQPEIQLQEITAAWDGATRNRTVISLHATVHNPNAYPVPTPSFTGSLRLNDVTVADWDASQLDSLDDTSIPPEESREIPFRIVLDNSKMTDWLRSHIRDNEQTAGTLTVSLLFDIGGTRFTLPRDGMKCRFDIQTAILVDGQEQNTTMHGCDQDSTDSGTGTGTDDSDDLGDSTDNSSLENDTEDDTTSLDDLL